MGLNDHQNWKISMQGVKYWCFLIGLTAIDLNLELIESVSENESIPAESLSHNESSQPEFLGYMQEE